MSKKFDTIWHIFLYAGLVVGMLAAYLGRFNPASQFLVLLMLVAFYLIWGMAYHHAKRDADTKLFLEYAFIALIAIGVGYLVLMS